MIVYRFATGTTWNGGVERVARLLGGVHALPGHGFRSLPVDGGAILADGDRFLKIDRGREIAQAAPGSGALRSGRPPARAPRRRPGQPDRHGTDLVLIDWQCPGAGDPVEDLRRSSPPAFQMLYGREPLTADEEEAFLDAYPDAARGAPAAADAPQLRLADGGVLRLAGGAAGRRRPGRERDVHARRRRAARAAVKRYLQSYCLRHHYAHAPGYDVFAFLDRAAAAATTASRSTSTAPATGSCRARRRRTCARVRARLDRARPGVRPRDERHRPRAPRGDPRRSAMPSAPAGCARTCVTRAASPRRSRTPTADLRAVAPRLRGRGVDLLLENHEDLTGAELATILAAVDHPAVAALFDYGNSMMVGEEPAGGARRDPPPRPLRAPEGPRLRGRPGRRAVGAGRPIGSGRAADRRADAPARRPPLRGRDRVERLGVPRAGALVARRREPGEGVFQVERPPFDPLLRPWDRCAPERLVELEAEALDSGEAWLRGVDEIDDRGRPSPRPISRKSRSRVASTAPSASACAAYAAS